MNDAAMDPRDGAPAMGDGESDTLPVPPLVSLCVVYIPTSAPHQHSNVLVHVQVNESGKPCMLYVYSETGDEQHTYNIDNIVGWRTLMM